MPSIKGVTFAFAMRRPAPASRCWSSPVADPIRESSTGRPPLSMRWKSFKKTSTASPWTSAMPMAANPPVRCGRDAWTHSPTTSSATDHLGIANLLHGRTASAAARRQAAPASTGTRRGRRVLSDRRSSSEDPEVMSDTASRIWPCGFRERRPKVSTATIQKYLSLSRAKPDSLYSVPSTSSAAAGRRSWSCRTTRPRIRCQPRSTSLPGA